MEVEQKMANVNNIIVGAANVWVSKKDSTQVTAWPTYAIPTFTAGTTAATAMDAATGADGWRNVGFTSEGIEVQYSPDYGDIQVDQLLDTAKLFKQAMTVSVNTTLAEATLENLLFSFAQAGSTKDAATGAGADTAYAKGTGGESLGLEAGALGAEPVERALVFIGNAPRSAAGVKRERLYHARRVLNVEASSHSYRRNEATVFPVSFRLLPDPAFSGAEYGMIVDRNIAGA
jgi:hypothetical protein